MVVHTCDLALKKTKPDQLIGEWSRVSEEHHGPAGFIGGVTVGAIGDVVQERLRRAFGDAFELLPREDQGLVRRSDVALVVRADAQPGAAFGDVQRERIAVCVRTCHQGARVVEQDAQDVRVFGLDEAPLEAEVRHLPIVRVGEGHDAFETDPEELLAGIEQVFVSRRVHAQRLEMLHEGTSVVEEPLVVRRLVAGVALRAADQAIVLVSRLGARTRDVDSPRVVRRISDQLRDGRDDARNDPCALQGDTSPARTEKLRGSRAHDEI